MEKRKNITTPPILKRRLKCGFWNITRILLKNEITERSYIDIWLSTLVVLLGTHLFVFQPLEHIVYYSFLPEQRFYV